MNRLSGFVVLVCVGLCLPAVAEPESVVLENGVARMVVNTYGGAISSYSLVDQGLNPFTWKKTANKKDVSKNEGHFICFDRVGRSTQSEKKAGMPFHGEATSVRWTILTPPTEEEGHQILRMECSLPMAKMSLVREICLFKDSAVCKVTERVKNNNTFRKPYNLMQHVSIAAPFLDKGVFVDCSAERGFIHVRDSDEYPCPEILWPEVSHKGEKINLRVMDDGLSLVANYVGAPDKKYNWSCISNPSRELLVGYFWDATDYPWMRLWRSFKDGELIALGPEFSTTPLSFPFEQVEEIGDLLDTPTLDYLDPAAEKTRSYYLFLSKIPKDFSGVEEVSLTKKQLEVDEKKKEGARQFQLLFR